MTTAPPGRVCPVHYRTQPAALSHAASIEAETLYVVGGLYGNHEALAAIVSLAENEILAGSPAPVLVFNGDFLWFNADTAHLREVSEAALSHYALAGNVELELANPTTGAGCGCAYPDWVDEATVERSNRIMAHLHTIARAAPDVVERLGGLPRQLRGVVGDVHVGIVHGDPESVAGWGLSIESMPRPGEGSATLIQWFDDARVDVLAATHTCTAYMQDLPTPRHRLVVNNGAAGMPNFRGDRRGLITRIGLQPAPDGVVYGTTVGGVHCDALAVPWNTDAFDAWFARHWPPGSPAWASYGHRFRRGPPHTIDEAYRVRGTERAGPSARVGTSSQPAVPIHSKPNEGNTQ